MESQTCGLLHLRLLVWLSGCMRNNRDVSNTVRSNLIHKSKAMFIKIAYKELNIIIRIGLNNSVINKMPVWCTSCGRQVRIPEQDLRVKGLNTKTLSFTAAAN